MKLHPRFTKTYELLKRPGRFGLAGRPYLLPIFGLVFGVLAVGLVIFFGSRENFRPSSSHVVFIFDNGKQGTVSTRVDTVGDLVKKLPLNLIPQDVVEPSPKTQIVEDNFRINIYRARPVTVVAGGNKAVVLTGQRSARVIAAQAGLDVHPEDLATFEAGQISEGVLGEKVVVVPSKPAHLNLYGTSIDVRTQANTVDGLLREKGIVLAKGDSVKPALATKLTPKTVVFVMRAGTKIVTETQVAPAPTKVINDSSLTFGVTVVRQPGQPGKKLITYALDKSGKKTRIQTVIIQDAVPEIVARGTNVDIPKAPTAIMSGAGISSADYQYVNYIVSRESGWCYTKWQGEYGGCPSYHGAPSYGGYGLCQATPPGKMVSAGSDWAWNPITQMRWCDSYAQARYGGWANAYNHWLVSHNW